jgi:hypothetical protein
MIPASWIITQKSYLRQYILHIYTAKQCNYCFVGVKMTTTQNYQYLTNLLTKLELKTCVVDIKTLRPHEEVIAEKVNQVKRDILSRGYVKYPVLVDLKTFVILDGHHRVEALKQLGFDKAPVFFVDYSKSYIIVKSFRKDFNVTKQLVVEAGLSNRLLPPKTSRHILVRIPLPSSFVPIYILSSSRYNWCLPTIEKLLTFNTSN